MMAINEQIVGRDAPIRLNDIRMSAFERADAQRHIAAGVAIADLALDLCRVARILPGKIGKSFGRVALPRT